MIMTDRSGGITAAPSSAASFATALAAVADAAAAVPDVETLRQWANAMFAAPPGAAPSGAPLDLPGRPAVPRDVSQGAALSVGAPPVVSSAAPAAARLAGGPSLPRLEAPSVPLPGEAELRALLAPLLAARLPAAAGLPSSESGYYFLEGGLPSAGAIAPAALTAPAPFDVNAIRRDFPILQETVHGRPLIWLDSAATTQKPQAVIDRLAYFYQHENSNIHRAAHALAAKATDAYEAAREKVRRFLNAPSVDEIVFVRGATEAINLVAQSWGRKNITAGDEIVITWLEHHANIVPWQQLCTTAGGPGRRPRTAAARCL